MTRSQLATLYDQLRQADLPPRDDLNARMAAEAFNGWLMPRRKKLLRAAGYVARNNPVPQPLAEELQHAGAAADARRATLRKVFGRDF